MGSFKNTRPLPSNCLFCGNECSAGLTSSKLNIPGAGNCISLNRQLEQLFVVKVLLEIDTKFLGEKLPFASHLQWFPLCEGCRELEVKPAWQAYQRMLEAEAKLKGIRARVKEEMEDTIRRKLKKHKDWAGVRGKRIDAEIRKWVFPDLLGVKKVPVTKLSEKTVVERPRPRYTLDMKLDVDDDDLDLGPNSPEPVVQDDLDMDWEPENADVDDLPEEEDNLRTDEDFNPNPKGHTSKSKKGNKPKSTSVSRSAVANAVKRVRKRIRIRKRKPRPIELIKRFKCVDCGCYNKSHELLVAHTEAHQRRKESGDGAFDCQKCTFPASSEEELEAHMKGRHGRIRYHKCPQCNYKVKNWKSMGEHLSAEHPDIAESKRDEICLRCQVCHRQFRRRQHWMLHQRKMHPELFEQPEEHPVECPDCGQRFLSRRLLRFHVNSAHRPRPSKYVCEECGMGFLWPKKLEYHMIKHTRKFKRDFQCHLCGVDYAHSFLLVEHYKKVHPGETEEGGAKKDSENQEEYKCRYCDLTSPYKVVISRHLSTHKEESGYRCNECGNCYINEQGLKRHIRMNHSKIPKIPCPYCRKLFSNADYMKSHVRLYCKLKDVTDVEPGPSFVVTSTTGEDSESSVSTVVEQKIENQEFLVPVIQQVEQYGNEMEMKVVFQYN